MRIGELAMGLGINPKTIRYYESIGLLPEPARTASGYRDYDEAGHDRLVFIKTAQRLGLTLNEIGEVLALRDRRERPCDYVLGVLHRQVTDIDHRIAELAQLRNELVTLTREAERIPDTSPCYCSIIEHSRQV